MTVTQMDLRRRLSIDSSSDLDCIMKGIKGLSLSSNKPSSVSTSTSRLVNTCRSSRASLTDCDNIQSTKRVSCFPDIATVSIADKTSFDVKAFSSLRHSTSAGHILPCSALPKRLIVQPYHQFPSAQIKPLPSNDKVISIGSGARTDHSELLLSDLVSEVTTATTGLHCKEEVFTNECPCNAPIKARGTSSRLCNQDLSSTARRLLFDGEQVGVTLSPSSTAGLHDLSAPIRCPYAPIKARGTVSRLGHNDHTSSLRRCLSFQPL